MQRAEVDTQSEAWLRPIWRSKPFFQMTQNLCPIAGQAIIAGQTRAGCRFREFLSLYTSHHYTSYAFKPVKRLVSGFKENRDGKGTQQQELNNMNPSNSSPTVSRLRGGHSNRADEICPFWQILRGPPQYSAVFARNYFQMAKSYAAVGPVDWFVWGFRENRDGWSAEQEELNNVSPSNSSHSVIVPCGDHSNHADGIRPFWPILRGPTFKWPSSTLPTIARLMPLGQWTDLCEDLEKTETVEALSRKSLTMWPQARALTVS